MSGLHRAVAGRAGGASASEHAIDLVFAVVGVRLPGGYAAELWAALVRGLPWLADEPGVGVHAIRAPACDGSLLLSRRTRLALRVPTRRQADALRLSGQQLDVGGERLAVGTARTRPLEPYPTLSARFVATGASDALAHEEAVEAMLGELDMPLHFICGRMRTVRLGDATVSGAEVVLHQLRPEQSLAMQERGLGGQRHLGHGLFVPHKTISDID
ncbi:MAG TPA: type I-MYXAN CRISPR-associated protein Cas6/Cmx6 [Zeimonas sp.]|nr:type I-MYXAN CRISPR-associated protein Cas6/Cmx6 [Zeimonas sp.]